MLPFEREVLFRPPGKVVKVMTLASRCDSCGKETVLPSQMEENIARRAARQSEYGLNLLGEDIFAFRRKYGLTQQAVSKIFGKGTIAFSLYESEKSYPDASTTKLIRLAMKHSHVLKELADEAQVEIPLWAARCADEKASKLRNFCAVPMLRMVFKEARHGAPASLAQPEKALHPTPITASSELVLHETDVALPLEVQYG